MNKKKAWRTTAYWVLAVFVFGLLLLFTFSYPAKGAQKQKARIVVLGDSIMGIVRDDTSVTARLSAYLGEPVINGAFGGTCMSRPDKERRIAYTKDGLSMAALSKAIVTEDFGVQQTVRIKEAATEYFEETVDELAKIDFDSVEILIISHGLNDYHGGAVLTNHEDPYDEYSFTGALRSSIDALQRRYPEMRIILLTPTYSWYLVQGMTCEELDAGHGLLEEFVEAEKQVAAELGIEVIDLYHDFYPHETWEDYLISTDDGLHPNNEARERLARYLADYLEET